MDFNHDTTDDWGHSMRHVQDRGVMDLATRYLLSWRLSNTLDTEFCLEALEELLDQGCPEMFNLDNVFVERLWRTVKYEYVYLETVPALTAGLTTHFGYYNGAR